MNEGTCHKQKQSQLLTKRASQVAVWALTGGVAVAR